MREGRLRRSTRSSRRPASARSTSSATASAARCSPRRSPTWRRKGDDADRVRDLLRHAWSTSPRPASSPSSSTRSSCSPRRAHEREGLSRRPRHGDDLQHAARQRSDLVVRRQQLPAGQGALPVRPAVLERRSDAHAGGDAQLLSAQDVPARTCWSQRAASRCSACTIDLRKIKIPVFILSTQGGPHRAVASTYAATQLYRRAGHVHAGRLRPYRRRRQPAAGKKYGHWTNDKNPPTPDEWLAGASKSPAPGGRTGTSGSRNTAAARSPARQPGDGKLKPIEPAPGTYVKVKASD